MSTLTMTRAVIETSVTAQPSFSTGDEMSFITRHSAVFPTVIILLSATAGSAVAQKRTVLQTIDFPAGYEILSVIAELEPGKCTGRHSHPGAESAYVLEGGAVAKFDGKPDLIL